MSVECAIQEMAIWRRADTVVGGGAVTGGYASVPDERNVPVEVLRQSPGWAKREFGIDSRAPYRGLVSDAWSFSRKDVVKITAGAYTGTYLMVEEAIPVVEEPELVLVLVDTNEAPTGA